MIKIMFLHNPFNSANRMVLNQADAVCHPHSACTWRTVRANDASSSAWALHSVPSFFTPKERMPIQLCILIATTFTSTQSGRWKVFLCLTLFSFIVLNILETTKYIVLIILKLTDGSLLPKASKAFYSPFSPHWISFGNSEKPRSSPFHFYLDDYSKPFTNSFLGEAFSDLCGTPMFSIAIYGVKLVSSFSTKLKAYWEQRFLSATWKANSDLAHSRPSGSADRFPKRMPGPAYKYVW